MGRTSKWFRSLLTSKKSSESSPAKENNKKKTAAKWGAPSNSGNNSVALKNHAGDPLSSPYIAGLDANRHAIAVAAATAAVAEAALAAAHAAAQVVRLTSGGASRRGAAPTYGGGDRRRPVAAAVRIQSAFRAYLARRALRALKGLVKLQALVRGHIVRKQSADMLRRMQAMARIQARASTHRSYTSDYSNPTIKFSNSHHTDVANSLGKYEQRTSSSKHCGSLIQQNNSRLRMGNNNSSSNENSHLASRWLNHWMEQSTWNNLHDADDERSDKILEVDTWKPHHPTATTATRNDQNAPPTSQYFSAWQDHSRAVPLSSKHQKPNPSASSEDFSSLKSQNHQISASYWTAENSPRLHSSSSVGPTGGDQRRPFTPARSECSRSLFGDFLGHPNYMANTESSRAKVRSYSAPKQRFEELAKFSRDFWETDTISEKGSVILPTNNRSTYQVKRQGTPTRNYRRKA
ncbi:hypothetical protein ABFX02_06G111900 [Erythranthe guttata]